MKKIAVIGGGIFGTEAAIQLALVGNDVTLFEVNSRILEGATANSVLRLHLGFHYPRSLETAAQSKISYKNFVARFPDSVDFEIENYYAISKVGSRTSTADFVKFVENAQLKMKKINAQQLDQFGFNSRKADSIWKNLEGSICVVKLRDQIMNELDAGKVSLRMNTEIRSAEYSNASWTLRDSKSQSEKFDFVVRATYGSDRIEIHGPNLVQRAYEFHKTLVLEAETGLPKLGMTVIDGDFLTVLPKAFSESSLIYGPKPSVLDRHEGINSPSIWHHKNELEINIATEKIIERYSEWFEVKHDFIVKNRLVATRAIEQNVSHSDRRISQIEERSLKFIDVCSGKIDHCTDVAAKIVKMIMGKYL
jgi:hypothetical protein